MRWILITGTSTGIGKAVALRLAAEGAGVLAGVRKPQDADRLMSEYDALPERKGRLEPVLLDVTDASTIAGALARAGELSGGAGLWALLNNAGIVVPGPVEHLTLDDWRRQFEVNVFGMIEATRQALPLLRRGVATYGRGVPRIGLVSSIGGRVAQPIIAPYTASKWATTALGDSLRIELNRQGIGVTVFEPGAVASAIWGKADTATVAFGPDHPARALYSPELDAVAALSLKTARNALPADSAARLIARALHARNAPAHVLIGTDAKVGAFLKRFLPYPWFESLLIRTFGIPIT